VRRHRRNNDVRNVWAIATFVTALFAAGAVSDHASDAARGGCERALPHAPSALPAPVIVTTHCGRFRFQGGTVSRLGPRTLPVPRGVTAYWADFTWYRPSQGHLLIGRGHRLLWRSHRRYAARYAASIGVVVVGARRAAFSYFRGRHSRLYVARFGAAEHVVGSDETPLLFLRSGGLVAWRYHGGALVVRSENGRVARVLAGHAGVPQVDRRSGALVFRASGRVYAFAEGRVHTVAELQRLGFGRAPIVETLGHAVAIRDRRRLAVVGYDGRLIASTTLPPRKQRADTISSAVVANAAGTAFAFTATANNTAGGSRGRETVYVLRAGEEHARPVHTEHLQFKVCERMTELAWHGAWLLSSSVEHRVALIDTSRNATIDVSTLVTALPGVSPNGYFDVGWATTRAARRAA
jgi:hypothetical protein